MFATPQYRRVEQKGGSHSPAMLTSGVGQVLVSFAFSATLTIIASIYKEVRTIRFLNPKSHAVRPGESWLDRFILSLSDQQLLTGISILLIGFTKIATISTYHFNLVLHLATFSCASHIASVIALRAYFIRYPSARIIRVTLMLIFAVFLLAGSGLPLEGLAIHGSLDGLKQPLHCAIRVGKPPIPQICLTILAFICGYGIAFFKYRHVRSASCAGSCARPPLGAGLRKRMCISRLLHI
jgi:hypothetical protein